MTKSNLPLYILLSLAILLLIICFYNTRKREYFTATPQKQNNPIVNLPGNDIHFITDNNPQLIDTPVFNYKINKINQANQNNQAKTTETNDIKTDKYLSVFQHKPFDLYRGLGQYVALTDKPYENVKEAIKSVLDKKCLNFLTSSPIKPVGYNLIWTSDLNDDNKIFSVWSVIPPSGCVALGDVIIMGTEQPPLDYVACYPITMLEKRALSNGIIWKAGNDMGKMCYCWGAGNIDTFKCSNIYSADMPELQSVYNLTTSVLNNNTVIGNAVSSNNKNKLDNLQEQIKGGITV